MAVVACKTSRKRVVIGAPTGTHLRTRFCPWPAGKNGLFQNILAALDADMRVIDLDDVDQRT
jgi:hypothetical protein